MPDSLADNILTILTCVRCVVERKHSDRLDDSK